ncbi:MAG: hypothetical protein ACFFAN_10705 [Promethearchaeota archaeon]
MELIKARTLYHFYLLDRTVSITNLKSLERLKLNKNQLTILPKFIITLKSLVSRPEGKQ